VREGKGLFLGRLEEEEEEEEGVNVGW